MASAAAAEIELGRDIRVRVARTAPEDLAAAIIKALATRYQESKSTTFCALRMPVPPEIHIRA